jgi:hypothetical protein
MEGVRITEWLNRDGSIRVEREIRFARPEVFYQHDQGRLFWYRWDADNYDDADNYADGLLVSVRDPREAAKALRFFWGPLYRLASV